MARPKPGEWQRQTLIAALEASDGYLTRGASRVWWTAPRAVHACIDKGWLRMTEDGNRARLTPAGRKLAEKHRAEGHRL